LTIWPPVGAYTLNICTLHTKKFKQLEDKNDFTLVVNPEGHCMTHSPFVGKSNHSTNLEVIQDYSYTINI